MLVKEEYDAYTQAWKNWAKEKFGQELPSDPELEALAFDASRATGKEGHTHEDYQLLVEWTEAAVQAAMAKNKVWTCLWITISILLFIYLSDYFYLIFA